VFPGPPQYALSETHVKSVLSEAPEARKPGNNTNWGTIMDAFIFTVGCLISLAGFSYLTLATIGLI
jgi:hypothetical protein